MPRKKLSEYRAKILVNGAIGISRVGWAVSSVEGLDVIEGCDTYVVKVDQAIKGRFKKGLVILNVKSAGLVTAAKSLFEKGYTSLIVEPYMTHDASKERYIALSRTRAGLQVLSSTSGGVDVEQHAQSMKAYIIDDKTPWTALTKQTGLKKQYLEKLITLFRDEYMVSLEINPYIVDGTTISILDAAIEVDDAGEYFAHGWSGADLRSSQKMGDAEKRIAMLNAKSPASFNLTILNPNGSLFLLLSGGGASIVIADEIYNRGLGGEIANYGEYSGNPSRDETKAYAQEFFDLLFASTAKQKRIFIGGAVANFTDIAATFAGIIDAMDERASQLKKQNIKVYVRRGGPNEVKGLENMTRALKKHGILGGIYGPDVSIGEAVERTLEGHSNE